jgi:hypothetical protein
MLLCTATSNGTTTTFIDTLNLNHEQSILLGRHGWNSTGNSNDSRVVRVTANVKSTQTLTFTPALPNATAIGDEMELWNQRNEGLTPTLVNDILNDVIADVYENGPVPVVSDAFTFDNSSPILEIDDLEVDGVADGENWEAITRVEYRSLTEDADLVYTWNRLPTDESNFDVDRYNRTITLKGRAYYLANGNQIRIWGANISGALTSDTDTTQLSAEFLAHQVAATALGYRLEKAFDRKDIDITRAGLQLRADQLRPKTNLRLKGRYWRLT